MKIKKIFLWLTLAVSCKTVISQTADFSFIPVCLGTVSTLTATCSLHDSLISQYKWDLNNDGIYGDAYGKIVTYLFPNAGSFPVSLEVVDKSNNTYISGVKSVLVHHTPVANFQVDNLCEGKTATFKNLSTISSGSIVQYNWDFNNDGVVDDNSGPVVTFNCGPAQTYLTKLEVISEFGCSASTVKATTVYNQPYADFTVQSNCAYSLTQFTDQTTIANDNIAVYLWDFGTSGSLNTLKNPTYQFTAQGVYPVKLVVISENGCRDTMIRNITINPPIDFVIEGDSVIYNNSTITLNINGGFTSYSWSNGANTNIIMINQPGLYTVTVTDVNGCNRTKSKNIIQNNQIQQNKQSNTILTPNGDGINDYLIFDINQNEHVSLIIFNKWGDKVFENNNYNNNWDGRLNGNGPFLDAGTYYYVLKTWNGESYGNINILR